MNFDFTEEQIMLRDSVERYMREEYDINMRRETVSSEAGMNGEHWRNFAELGWLSVPFSEEHGGFGGSAVDTMLMMEEFGKGLLVEPYFSNVLLFGAALQKSGNQHLQDTVIPKIIDGSTLGALAYLERQSRFELSDVKTSATASSDGFVLNGEKVVVFNGANANQLIVSARTSGDQSDKRGISLFLVAADTQGVTRSDYRLMDGQRVANIVLNDVCVSANSMLGELDSGYEILAAVAMEANLALAAEALGIMGQLNAKTLEYTKTREQFGVAIGSFQALQHRMVDSYMDYEQTKSLLYRAVCALNNGEEDAATAIHALKVMVDRAGSRVYAEAIQLHGGMGFTDELDIGHYAKRLMMIITTFGNGDYHQAKFNAIRYN